ncbi:unnamed protein product [Protopolystoma xenopodis]|uniref:Uncharacterized protein n=1 Tax=Protopolystoma xenopodis TaxID=117903 RepID=A0A3S5BP03_9PLAT|nr:unnamed protein product [Protopolystoma xenopodis]
MTVDTEQASQDKQLQKQLPPAPQPSPRRQQRQSELGLEPPCRPAPLAVKAKVGHPSAGRMASLVAPIAPTRQTPPFSHSPHLSGGLREPEHALEGLVGIQPPNRNQLSGKSGGATASELNSLKQTAPQRQEMQAPASSTSTELAAASVPISAGSLSVTTGANECADFNRKQILLSGAEDNDACNNKVSSVLAVVFFAFFHMLYSLFCKDFAYFLLEAYLH